MSRDKKKNYFDDNFLNNSDDSDQKDNTADFRQIENLSHRSNEKNPSKQSSNKNTRNYIQNYKNTYKNQGYSDIVLKKLKQGNPNNINFSTNSTTNAKLNIDHNLSNQNTINYENNAIYFPQESYPTQSREVGELSHSPTKLVDALQNIDKNLFVKITKKDNKKIENNFPVRRASNFREKTKNSLTSLGNVLNSNHGSSQNVTALNKEENQGGSVLFKENLNTEKVRSNSKSKVYQRNLANNQEKTQGTNLKASETASENNNETADDITNKNSRNISHKDIKDLGKESTAQPTGNSSNLLVSDKLVDYDEKVYRRPARAHHKRELSQDLNDVKKIMNRTAEAEYMDNKDKENVFKEAERSAKNLPNKEEGKSTTKSSEKNMKSPFVENRNLVNVNSQASLTKNISKNVNVISQNKLEISTSTITDNLQTKMLHNNLSNLPFIYDESIKDHASEEKEINVDRLLIINKRFLEILRTNFEESNVDLKSNVSVSTACKVANELFTELKSEADKEVFEALKRNRELEEENKRLIKENSILKENMLKTAVTNNNNISSNDKSFSEANSTIKDLQKYILKLEKENVVLKNEFINNIKNKNGMIKKFNEDLNDYTKITNNFMEKFSQICREEDS